MRGFIELTRVDGLSKIAINVSHIVSFAASEDGHPGTRVQLLPNEGWAAIEVVETFLEVADAIDAAE